MSDSDDFFGDDSDFDDSEEFSSEDPEIRDDYVPSKSKNQEEDAVDSQRKAEAIAKEEAAKAAEDAKKETESKTDYEDITNSERDTRDSEDLEAEVGKSDSEEGQVIDSALSSEIVEKEAKDGGNNEHDADEFKVDEDQEQFEEQAEEAFDDEKEDEELADVQEEEEFVDEAESADEQYEAEEEIVESDHAQSACDVVDSYDDDDDVSASVSEDNDGNDVSESQPDVVSAEEEEERVVKEGRETLDTEVGYTDVGEERAELKHLCSQSPSAVREVAATKIQAIGRGHGVRKLQLAEERELARLREANNRMTSALRKVNPEALQRLQQPQKGVADTSKAESTINSLLNEAANRSDPSARQAAPAPSIGPPTFNLHNRLPSSNRFQYPRKPLPFAQELLNTASRQLPVGPRAMRQPSHKFVRYNGVWVRQKRKPIMSKSRRKVTTKAKSRNNKTRKPQKSKKPKRKQKGYQYKEVEWHRYAQAPSDAKTKTKHKAKKKKARQLKRRGSLQMVLEVVDQSARAADAARVAESYAMQALFSHLDPNDPNIFTGMEKGMVRRILDLRDEKGSGTVLDSRVSSDASMPRKKRRQRTVKSKPSPIQVTATKKGPQAPKEEQKTEAPPKKRKLRRANSIFSPIVQLVFKRIDSCYTYSALLRWRATVRKMVSFDQRHYKMLRKMSFNLKNIPMKGDKDKETTTSAETETQAMLARLLCLGELSKAEMCRILEVKPISPSVDDDEVERLMVQHFKRRSKSSWVSQNEFIQLLREFGVEDSTFAQEAFAAFSPNASKGAKLDDVLNGVCIFMRFPFARVLNFYFGSIDNQMMTRVELRKVLRQYAPALFAREADAEAIDQLLYDLDTCSFGVSPPVFMQQIATVPSLHEILCNDPKFFK